MPVPTGGRDVIVAICCAQPPTRAYAPTGAFTAWGGGAAEGGALVARQQADARGAADQRGAGTGASTHGCGLPCSYCCLRGFLSTPHSQPRQAFIVDFLGVDIVHGPIAGPA